MSRTAFFITALALIVSSLGLFAQGHVIMTPELADQLRKYTTYAPAPQYPASARAHGLQGSGTFYMYVRSDGAVSRVTVHQSTGYRELDKACISAYSQWHFRKEFAAKIHKVKIPVTFANP
jgi:TonB family protein